MGNKLRRIEKWRLVLKTHYCTTEDTLHYFANLGHTIKTNVFILEFCMLATGREVGGNYGHLSYRRAGAPAVTTRFRPCAAGWRTGPSPG